MVLSDLKKHHLIFLLKTFVFLQCAFKALSKYLAFDLRESEKADRNEW